EHVRGPILGARVEPDVEDLACDRVVRDGERLGAENECSRWMSFLRMIDHRPGKVEAGVFDVERVFLEEVDQRPVAAADVIQREGAVTISDAKKLSEAGALRLLPVPVDATGGCPVLDKTCAVVPLDLVEE